MYDQFVTVRIDPTSILEIMTPDNFDYLESYAVLSQDNAALGAPIPSNTVKIIIRRGALAGA
jgi:hypothetical protein